MSRKESALTHNFPSQIYASTQGGYQLKAKHFPTFWLYGWLNLQFSVDSLRLMLVAPREIISSPFLIDEVTISQINGLMFLKGNSGIKSENTFLAYSYLSASIGFSIEAFLAGYKPNTTPITRAKQKAKIIDCAETADGHCVFPLPAPGNTQREKKKDQVDKDN